MRGDVRHAERHHGGMTDLPTPDFGDVVGLRRLYKAAVQHILQMAIPEARKRAWVEKLAGQNRAARAASRHFVVATSPACG